VQIIGAILRNFNICYTCSLAGYFKKQYGNPHIRMLDRTSENHKNVFTLDNLQSSTTQITNSFCSLWTNGSHSERNK